VDCYESPRPRGGYGATKRPKREGRCEKGCVVGEQVVFEKYFFLSADFVHDFSTRLQRVLTPGLYRRSPGLCMRCPAVCAADVSSVKTTTPNLHGLFAPLMCLHVTASGVIPVSSKTISILALPHVGHSPPPPCFLHVTSLSTSWSLLPETIRKFALHREMSCFPFRLFSFSIKSALSGSVVVVIFRSCSVSFLCFSSRRRLLWCFLSSFSSALVFSLFFFFASSRVFYTG